MHPQHLLAAEARLFRKGTAERHLDVPADLRQRIGAWAAAAMEGSTYPLRRHYPDLP
ncbi:MAG TPA: hypothetical protein VLL51_07810 [Gemmatimonadales bacterium]|nr:hypothetical protein [Gemmatimonadales bacterium]